MTITQPSVSRNTAAESSQHDASFDSESVEDAPLLPWQLRVRCGSRVAVAQPGEELTIGRTADLVIDSANRYLHRVVGTFSYRHGAWWFHNHGRLITVTIHDERTASQALVTPGADMPVASGAFRMELIGGPNTYVLTGEIDATPDIGIEAVTTRRGEPTAEWGAVRLNDEQRLLLTALAENHLRHPTETTGLPTNRQVAHSLGWTLPKYNRKLDHLCLKFARAGVDGLLGEIGVAAADRRMRLVHHCVKTGIVTKADIELLDVARR